MSTSSTAEGERLGGFGRVRPLFFTAEPRVSPAFSRAPQEIFLSSRPRPQSRGLKGVKATRRNTGQAGPARDDPSGWSPQFDQGQVTPKAARKGCTQMSTVKKGNRKEASLAMQLVAGPS